MGSFYGGREGHSFIITRTFESVKEMVEKGELSNERYKRYVEIYNDISKRRIIYEKNDDYNYLSVCAWSFTPCRWIYFAYRKQYF